MQQLNLRPLSLGEILDRTFSLYRRHFLLFLGIAAIPNLLTLGLNLAQVFLLRPQLGGTKGTAFAAPSSGLLAFGIVGIIIGVFVYMVAYLFAQGGTIYAVSDLYLGRPTTIGASLRRMWGQLLNLFGVSMLNGIAIIISAIFDHSGNLCGLPADHLRSCRAAGELGCARIVGTEFYAHQGQRWARVC